MTEDGIKVQHWPAGQTLTEADIRRTLAEHGLHPYRWSNAPGDEYATHSHPYHKVIYVVQGSITFRLAGQQAVTLRAGDRLDLPSGTQHNAVIGSDGVVCLEAHYT